MKRKGTPAKVAAFTKGAATGSKKRGLPLEMEQIESDDEEDEDDDDEEEKVGLEDDEDEDDEDDEEEDQKPTKKAGKARNLEDFMGGGGDDDEDDEELPFEKEARELAEADSKARSEAEADLKESFQAQPKFKLKKDKAAAAAAEEEEEEEEESGDDEDDEEEEEEFGVGSAEPPSVLKERIADVVEVLSDFKNRREEGKSRQEYMGRLAKDLCEYYGYIRELAEHFLEMFSPAE